MSAPNTEAPYDNYHIPLTIIPSQEFPYDPNDSSLSEHHEFYRMRSNFDSLSGIAMRGARVLLAEQTVHNQGKRAFHRFYWESPGPSSETDRLRVILLSLAEYFPEQGVDLWSGGPVIRDIEPEELEILRRPNPETGQSQNLIHYPAEIRRFFWQHLMRQDFKGLDPELLGRLTKDKKKTSDVGQEMLEALVDMSVTPVRADYTEAYEQGRLGNTAMFNPNDIILGILGNTGRKDKMIVKMRSRIQERNRVGSLALGHA